jgi:ACT domain-containing protein
VAFLLGAFFMKITEEIIRKITLDTIKELGENATPELVKKIVNKAVEKLTSEIPSNNFEKPNNNFDSGKIILTAFGLNHSGIVSSISSILAEYNCDIQDITQKILQDYFTMIMIIDISDAKVKFNDLRDSLMKVAEKLNIKIFIQHEDVFKFMHRI